ncbi:HAD family hydrolase [Enterococcus sp. AZ103]|uniref:HAD family hydrolase n=1 Tax=Enterococcus sp. AZ103 TaxID=2774628 RepID=UPI003F27403F
MITTVIFDMDGVLIDSEYIYFASKTQVLKNAGITVTESYHYQFMGTTKTFMWQKMKEEFNLPKEIDFYITEMDKLRTEFTEKDGVRPIPGAQDLVRNLHQAGLKLAVASSSSLHEIKSSLSALQLTDLFQEVVSTEEVPHSKPAPDVYQEAMKRLGVTPEETVGIEDTLNGSRAVKAAEMFCIGYANPSFPTQDLSAADVVINDLAILSREKIEELSK